MARTLGEEYHGHKCHMAFPYLAGKNEPPDITLAATQWSILLERYLDEDEYADDQYISGEITRAEWELARERLAMKWGRYGQR